MNTDMKCAHPKCDQNVTWEVDFRSEGRKHTLGLCTHHADDLADAVSIVDEYAALALSLRRPGSSNQEMRRHARLVRAWAAANGITVPARGRLSDEVKAAYSYAVSGR